VVGGPERDRGKNDNLGQGDCGSPSDLFEWVGILKKMHERRVMILAFANNHFAGHGPSTVELFRKLWGIEAPRVVHRPQRTGQQPSLFD